MNTHKRKLKVGIVALLLALFCLNNAFAQNKTIVKNREAGLIYTPTDKLGVQFKFGKKENKYWRFAFYSVAKAESALSYIPTNKDNYAIDKFSYNFSIGRERRIKLSDDAQFIFGGELSHAFYSSFWSSKYSIPSYWGDYFNLGAGIFVGANYTIKNVVLSASFLNTYNITQTEESLPKELWTTVYTGSSFAKATLRQPMLSVAWKFTKVKNKSVKAGK